MITIHLVCVPPRTTHQAKRIVRVGTWTRLADTPELAQTKALLETLLLPYVPAAPVTGPVRLALAYTWPWRAGDSARTCRLGRVPCPTRPDCTNLAKTLEDRLVALRFLVDDAQVVELLVTKWRGDTPGITIELTPWCAPVAPPGPQEARSATEEPSPRPLPARGVEGPTVCWDGTSPQSLTGYLGASSLTALARECGEQVPVTLTRRERGQIRASAR
jgi:Holliday junction resolvase RusA-like endonuclease